MPPKLLQSIVTKTYRNDDRLVKCKAYINTPKRTGQPVSITVYVDDLPDKILSLGLHEFEYTYHAMTANRLIFKLGWSPEEGMEDHMSSLVGTYLNRVSPAKASKSTHNYTTAMLWMRVNSLLW